MDADEVPRRFEAFDDAGRYVTTTQSLRGAMPVFSHQSTRWIQDRQPSQRELEAG